MQILRCFVISSQVFGKQLPNPIQTSPGSITPRDVNTRLLPTAQVTNEQLPSWLTSLYLLFTPPPPETPIQPRNAGMNVELTVWACTLTLPRNWNIIRLQNNFEFRYISLVSHKIPHKTYITTAHICVIIMIGKCFLLNLPKN